MKTSMTCPTNPYDPAWAQYNAENPDLRKSVGAAAPADDESGKAEPKVTNTSDVDKAASEAATAIAADKARVEAALKAKEAEVASLAVKVEEANARLRDFEGLDASQIKALLAERKQAEEAQLVAKGDFDRLKARMAEEHATEVSKIKQEIDALREQVNGKDGLINKLTIGHAFDGSKFIADELVLTSSKARALYGDHFEVEDGRVIAYDKPRGEKDRTPLVDGQGRAISFEDAIKRIVESDADKDSLLKSKLKSGAESNSNPNMKITPQKTILTPAEKILAGLKKGIGNK